MNVLIAKGCLKVANFSRESNTGSYAYLLTTHGAEQKARMTGLFLQNKIQECDRICEEAAELKREMEQGGSLANAPALFMRTLVMSIFA